MAELNGIELNILKEGLDAVKEQMRDPERNRRLNMRRARVSWVGGLKARVKTGNGVFTVDESLGPEPSETPTAVEYLLGTLGACIVIGFVYLATIRGIRIHNIETSLEGELDNIGTFLALSDSGHSGYKRISLTLYVDADAEEEKLKEIFRETLKRSPLVNTLRNIVELEGNIKVV
ncbi:MAG TPA: OsmC family peroxiredoxin [Candidatus Caldiarchaeum subterraneum]|uniref:OsmC family peroxiredoxin n=1 Tax=Caldiarchaeum subterraneum TaxID=311458 RepID=A0A833EAV5_CALS0|nr:OsmC family peroxiredoxin [Candidatus Caldarchaeum subterraneum]